MLINRQDATEKQGRHRRNHALSGVETANIKITLRDSRLRNRCFDERSRARVGAFP